MSNSGKYFTFLFSHSSKSKFFIKRVEVSKRLLQNGLLSIVFIFVFLILGIGIFGVFDLVPSIELQFASTLTNPAAAHLTTKLAATQNQIDYSRPEASDEFTFNSGGPEMNDSGAAEDSEIENQLKVIETSTNPAYLPAIWAHMGKINNEFGFRRNPFGGRTYEFHAGMDIDGERGDLVVAPANGTVSKAGWQGGYGNMIEIDHGNGLFTRYGHLSKIEVEVGDTLTRGQLMAFLGSTGRSTGPHLHYELRLGERPINPRRFLPPEPTEIKRVQG